MCYRSALNFLLVAALVAVGHNAIAIDSNHPGAALSTPLTITLHDTSGNSMIADVVAIDRESSGTVVATFHVAPELWDHINAEELFHTERQRRVGRVEGDFEPGRPIAIEATLDELVLKSLELNSASPADVLARLASIKANTLDAFLLSAQSWIARSVTQEVPLPPELRDKGSISEGFRMERKD